MKKMTCFLLTLLTLLPAALSFAAAGEKWEIITSGAMEGMPAITMNVCLQKGGEKDPGKLMQTDENCKVTDVKTAGGKTSWKMRCDNNGEVMSGSGEIRQKSDSFKGVTKLSGKSGGETVNMTATFQGRRLGTACDTSEPAETVKAAGDLNDIMGLAKSQMQSAMAEQCVVSNFRATELISTRFFGAAAVCAANQKHACKVISRAAAKEPEVFIKLARHDDTSDVSVATACGINMAAATKSICAKVDNGNYRDLAEYCPAEAKGFEPERSSPGKASSGAENLQSGTDSVIEGAKKLKGLFGF